jgi:hypothetical protein
MITIYTVCQDNHEDGGTTATVAHFTNEVEATAFRDSYVISHCCGEQDDCWVDTTTVYDTISQHNEAKKAKREAQAKEYDRFRALRAQCYTDATIEAAELVGPNSHEYASLVESVEERLFNERCPA